MTKLKSTVVAVSFLAVMNHAEAATKALTVEDVKGCLSDTVRTIGVVMPASIPAKGVYPHCKALFEKAGYRVKEASRLNFAKVAPVADRVADFEEMWMDPEVDLVFCVRGGNGAQDLVDKLDWARLRTRRQRVLGFSNITWLLNAMLVKDAGHPISGPSLTQFRYLDRPSLDWLAPALKGGPLPPQRLTAIRPGACRGLPCGGHIVMLRGMLQRKWLPDATGRVVFLECSVRHPPVVRGYLDELAASGWLTNCAGVVFGDITPGDANRNRLKGAARTAGLADVARIRRDFADRLSCPVYAGFPYGHVPLNFAIDFLREVEISADGILRFVQKERPCSGD